ncbi:hypothetical protein BCR35DRAFT_355885 [Leucosporidium creatinivorum]|uniref:Myb-like domain-containing protein n=1 Tax=Leucosporidium creatinivorum TaxID=106004 RepID=A0A1Y2D5P5_9BASI|nr:hypothetical protein BCR35DRAFT_355885 [Leucosporidium creatinivorum]
MSTGSGINPNDLSIDFPPVPAPKLEPSASPPAYLDPSLASHTSPEEASTSGSQPLPTAGPGVDPNREQVKSKWTPEDEAEVLEWTPLYLNAGKGFDDLAKALTKRRSPAAVKARWLKLTEGKEEFAHLVGRRKRSRTTTEEGSDRASSATPAPAQELQPKPEPVEASVQGGMRPILPYTGYAFQGVERASPSPAPWDIDEEARLTSAFLLRGDDWEAVQKEMTPTTRTAHELRDRWHNVTKIASQAIASRGLWSVPLPVLHSALSSTPGFDQPGHLFLNSDRKWVPIPPYFNAPATDATHQRTALQAQHAAREATSTPDPRLARSASQSNVGSSTSTSFDARNTPTVPVGYGQLLNSLGKGSAATSAGGPQQQQPQQSSTTAPSLPAAEDRAKALVAAHAAAQLQPRAPYGGGGAVPPFVNKPSPLATSTTFSASQDAGQGWNGGSVPSMSAGIGARSTSSNGSASGQAQESSRSVGLLPTLGRSEPAQRRFELPPLPGSLPTNFKLPPIASVASNTPPTSSSTPSTPVHFQPRPLPMTFPPQQTSSAQTPSTQAPFHLHQQPTSAEEAQRQLLRRVSGAIGGGSTPASAPSAPAFERSASFNYDLLNTPIAPSNPLYTVPRTQSTPALSFYSQSTSNVDAIVAASQRLPNPWTPAPAQSFHQSYSNSNFPPFPTLPTATQPYKPPVTPPIASSSNVPKTKNPTPPSTPRPRSTRAASQKADELMQKLVKESQEDDEDEEQEEWAARAAKAKAGQEAAKGEEEKEKDIPTAEDKAKEESDESGEEGSDEEWDGEDLSAERRGGARSKGAPAASKSAASPARKRARTTSESSLSSAVEMDEARTPAEGARLGGVGEENVEEIDEDEKAGRIVKKPKFESAIMKSSFAFGAVVAQEKPDSNSQEMEASA